MQINANVIKDIHVNQDISYSVQVFPLIFKGFRFSRECANYYDIKNGTSRNYIFLLVLVKLKVTILKHPPYLRYL